MQKTFLVVCKHLEKRVDYFLEKNWFLSSVYRL